MHKDKIPQETITSAVLGDADAFATIYNTYRVFVRNIALRFMKNHEDAEDLTQHIFIRLMKKIHTFRGESAFGTWLYRVAITEALMRLRHNKRVGADLLDRNPILLSEIEPKSIEDDGFSTYNRLMEDHDSRLEGTVDRIALEKAIDQLPAGYRLYFVLHDIEGYDHNEIAQMVGKSVGNSKSQTSKARQKMAKLLGHPRNGCVRNRSRVKPVVQPA